MPGIDISSGTVICSMCGRSYGKRAQFFPRCYALLYKGTGYLPYCTDCVNDLYLSFLNSSSDPKAATMQLCRKLDLYWNEAIFDTSIKQSSPRTVIQQYISKLNVIKNSGKSFDDTIRECGVGILTGEKEEGEDRNALSVSLSSIDLTPDIIAYWGPGYTQDMYQDLEQRKRYWLSNLPEGTLVNAGMDALIRQICSLEIDINRDRAAGKSVEKSVGMLNTLIGSMNLKPAQKDDSDSGLEKTPMGVWIKRLEDQEPVPEPDPELKDVDGIIKYILVWFYGHICHMLGIKNLYSRLYDEEIARLRVERPEFDDEDEEDLLYDVFGGGGDADGHE